MNSALIIILFLISTLIGAQLNSDIGISGRQFSSMEELIDYETASITEAKNPVDLAFAYLSRAESFLISGKTEKALDDLNCGYNLGLMCGDDKATRSILFRSYFGKILQYRLLTT